LQTASEIAGWFQRDGVRQWECSLAIREAHQRTAKITAFLLAHYDKLMKFDSRCGKSVLCLATIFIWSWLCFAYQTCVFPKKS